MRVTTYELRQIIVRPQQFVANKRAQRAQPEDSPFGPNPQRAWFEAAIRAYFRNARNRPSLWAQFNTSVMRSSVVRNRETLIRNAETLLDQFVAWDGAEPRAPAAPPFFKTTPRSWRGHLLAVPPHLSYIDGSGYRIRQLWTDRELDADEDDAVLLAAAARICAEGELGGGSVTAVEAWQLRLQTQNSWNVAALMGVEDELEERLDSIEDELSL